MFHFNPLLFPDYLPHGMFRMCKDASYIMFNVTYQQTFSKMKYMPSLRQNKTIIHKENRHINRIVRLWSQSEKYYITLIYGTTYDLEHNPLISQPHPVDTRRHLNVDSRFLNVIDVRKTLKECCVLIDRRIEKTHAQWYLSVISESFKVLKVLLMLKRKEVWISTHRSAGL